jgi:hypothetical protein
MTRRSSRVAAILAAQQRVAQARAQLDQVHHLHPRFVEAFNEYSDAIEVRRQLEQEEGER